MIPAKVCRMLENIADRLGDAMPEFVGFLWILAPGLSPMFPACVAEDVSQTGRLGCAQREEEAALVGLELVSIDL